MGGVGTFNLDLTTLNFAAQTGVPLSGVRLSNTITVSGVGNGAAVSIVGGDYRIDAGTFTAVAGTISDGQALTLRQTASAVCDTTTVATVTVGAATFAFNLRTVPCDTAIDPFTFTNRANVPVNSAQVSDTVTITGVNGATPISVTGGDYSIGCTTTFTSVAATINNNQTVCVRRTAAAGFNTLTTATLQVGTYSALFQVLTTAGPAFSVTPQIGSGSPSLGVRSDGLVFTWATQTPVLLAGTTGATAISGVTQIAQGGGHTLARRADGTVWAWGQNNYGQLGDGTTASRTVPGPVPGLANVTAVATSEGASHSLVLKADGTVWAWGYNNYGQLGDGTTSNRTTPVPVLVLTGVASIAAGSNFSFAVKADGSVWAWGYNNYGQLGDGTTANRSAPGQVPGLSGVAKIAASYNHALAVKTDGTLWAWGYNAQGQLGDGTITDRPVPAAVAGLGGVVGAAAGYYHSLVVKADGTVWAWGTNTNGQLGDGTTQLRVTPVQVMGFAGVVAVAAGFNHSLALKGDGSVWAWGQGALGNNAGGQSLAPVAVTGVGGVGTFALILTGTVPDPFAFLPVFGAPLSSTLTSNPITVVGLGTFVTVAAAVTNGEASINGGAFTTTPANVRNGDVVRVRVSSSASYQTLSSATLTIGGASGNSATFNVFTLRDPAQAATIPRVSLGSSHSFLLNTNGVIYGFGSNANGQLGNGTTLGSPFPTAVGGLLGVTQLASGANHALALNPDGTVATWGFNANYQLAGGIEPFRPNPSIVPGLTFVKSVSAGADHSLALKADGTVWAWGSNALGQLGNSSAGTRSATPVAVSGLTAIAAISAGGRHNLALTSAGAVYAWGANDGGQIGDGTFGQRATPVPVSALANVVAIAACGSHSLALKNDGTVVAWGANGFGQLGDGTQNNRTTPVIIYALGNNVGQIACGDNHSLALRSGGGLYTWGANVNSQLGDGTNFNRAVPLLVPTPANVVSIAGGGRHTAAIDTSAKLFIFGDNFFGQVGNKSGNYSPHSASLNALRGDSNISSVTAAPGTGVGTGSQAGSAVLALAGSPTGFYFGKLTTGVGASVTGTFSNQAEVADINNIALSVSPAGEFNLASTNCASVLPAGSQCQFTINFVPGAVGTRASRIYIASDVVGSPQDLALEGEGVAPAQPAVTLADRFVSFVPLEVGVNSAPVPVAITNTGSVPLSVSAVTSDAISFTASHTCASVAPGAACAVNVRFGPTVVGAVEAKLTITGNADSAIIAVSGTGVFAPPSDTTPNAFVFANQPNVAKSTVRVSNIVTIGGINAPAPISVSGGEYSIGCTATFVATPGTIANAQTVCVRHTSSPVAATGVTTTLIVGGVTAQFTSFTAADAAIYSVTLAYTGNGSGSVSSSPAGSTFASGTTIVFTAVPSAGSVLSGWLGCDTTLGLLCTIASISSAQTVTATFVTSYATKPGAPTIGAAAPGNSQATISYTEPANDGGSPITNYTATCNPGNVRAIRAGNAALPITITGLVNATPYACSVTATNAAGVSAPSATVSVTPAVGAALTLLSAYSKKTHGNAGPHNLPIDIAKTINQAVTVEPRMVGDAHTIVFQFDAAVTVPGVVTVVDQNGSGIGTFAATTIQGNEQTVILVGIPDNRRVSIGLANVNGITSRQVSLGFLVGDVNGSGSVNASDIAALKAHLTQNTGPANFQYDVNLSGIVNAGDMPAVKVRSGLVLP